VARATLAAVLAIAVLTTASCGGGDHTAARRDLKPPPLTVPRTTPPPATQPSTTSQPTSQPSTTTTTQPTTTTTEPSTTPTTTAPPPASRPSPSSGGEQAPSGNTRQDSPGHDVPPPRGSPAERFERFCRENPGACG
jgi:hypothetical protein